MSGTNMPKWFAVLAVVAGVARTILLSKWFYIIWLGLMVAYLFWKHT